MTECSCKFSDAWRCAADRRESNRIACDCACHRSHRFTFAGIPYRLPMHYILDGHKPVAVDLRMWAVWFETAERAVAKDTIGDVLVSTVFLSLDHNFPPNAGEPILFETMIFGGAHDGYQTRCATWEQAEAMHKLAVMLVRRASLKLIDGGSDVA